MHPRQLWEMDKSGLCLQGSVLGLLRGARLRQIESRQAESPLAWRVMAESDTRAEGNVFSNLDLSIGDNK